MQNPFLRKPEDYRRDLDLRKAAVEQIATYVALQLNRPVEEILPLVKKEISTGKALRVKDRPMKYLKQLKPGKRAVEDISFLKYLDLAIESGRILSPSLTIYKTAEEEKSVTADWLDGNIAARKASKNEMHRLTQMGETIAAQLKDYDQNARKIRINSVSGMHGFKGCPIFIKTGHSSLTTLCRAAAGYGNGTVERFLGGARHYFTPEIAKANIVAILTIENIQRWIPVMEKYDIHYPSAEETFRMIKRSADPYWTNEDDNEKIMRLLTNMTPLQRAVVLYSGDMYHFALYNESLAKRFILDFVVMDLPNVDIDPEVELKSLSGTDRAYIFSLCSRHMKGKTIDDLKVESPDGYRQVALTAHAVKGVLSRYSDLISTVFTPSHLPPTVGNIRDINRTTGIIADTDSTIFTTQWWVKWMTGNLKRGELEDRVWYMTTYAVCQCIAHNLGMLSANVGVERKYINRLSMKNEYGFPVLMNTNMSKTYAALVSICEGNVYGKYKLDLRGAMVRGSTIPKKISEAIVTLIKLVLNSVDTSTPISAYEVIKFVADIEIAIHESLLKGEYTYLRSDMIKPGGNKVGYYDLWQTAFGDTYGVTIEPPYPAVKVALELGNKTATKEWLAGMENRKIAEGVASWLAKYNRDKLNTILLPYQVIRGTGLPKEIVEVANLRKVIYDTCLGLYIVLEACGLFIVDREYRRLAHEFLGMGVGETNNTV